MVCDWLLGSIFFHAFVSAVLAGFLFSLRVICVEVSQQSYC